MILGFETLANAASYEIEPFIVNGRDARVEEFPFVVSIQSIVNATHSMHSCAGTVLNENWILTVR
jgi:secreted trypsin-like serine protease